MFWHARRQAVVKVYDTLAAVLVVLIGLDGNTGQRSIGHDVIGLTELSVSGVETAVKQL